MEDLGSPKTLEDILNGTSIDLAEEYFIDLAKKTAQLNLITMNKEDEFIKIRDIYLKDNDFGRLFEAERWHKGLEKFYQWFEKIKCKVSEGTEICLNNINETYKDPDVFLSFTHGDMAPSNNHIKDNQIFLLDFEYGGYRHALYDITCWNILCPLPEFLVEKIKYHYKNELLNDVKADDETFDKTWNYLCAWRALAMISWFPLEVLEKNRPWVDDWSMREAMLSTLNRLGKVCNNSKELDSLAQSVFILKQELSNRWGISTAENLLPKWPVFQEKE
ncbi:MAG: hypothetical protein KAX49_03065 [Halanaerobiales bacterium]|nr:hypothetical protein [Halanaerobiales bacterium]